MPLYLNNEDQAQCITPEEAIEALENGIRQFARGDAIRRPRIDNLLPTSRPDEFFCFSSMEGGIRTPGYYALRIKPDVYAWPVVDGRVRETTYSGERGKFGGLVFLYRVDNAEFLAIMNDGYVQHMRVAATAALGMRYLSRPDSRIMGIYGSGGMARFFPLTARAVRRIERIQVYSPTRKRLEAYCKEMEAALGCEVVPMETPEAVARNADILCGCTNSIEPVVRPEWIRPGMHLNNVTHWEFDAETCGKIDAAGILARRTPMSIVGFVDDDFGLRLNVMSYAAGRPEERAKIPEGRPNRNRYPNARIVDCCNWQTGKPYRRERPDEITILANASYGTLEGDGATSAGIQGIQFASVAGRIYERARERGLGMALPREMFLQDLPT